MYFIWNKNKNTSTSWSLNFCSCIYVSFSIPCAHNMPNILRLCTIVRCKAVIDELYLVCRNLNCAFFAITPNSWFPWYHNKIYVLPKRALKFFNLPMQSTFRVQTCVEFMNLLWPWHLLKVLNLNTIWLPCVTIKIEFLPLQSIAINYRHLQAKQLQSSLHKHPVKLKKKVQNGPTFEQQSGHPCCTLCKHYHPQ